MKTFASLALAFPSLILTVAAHGVIVTPPQRTPGAQMEAVCGPTIYSIQSSDNSGPIQMLEQSASSIVDAAACNLWLCKGYQFEANKNQVQSYTLGQVVPMEVKIIAPHTGYANVSIVDTKTNTIKGSELKSWSVYASTTTGVTADQTNFSITIPTDLTGCTTPGECVIQWFWYAPPSIDQAYESCVDFVIANGTAAVEVPTSSKVPTTSVAPIKSSPTSAEATSTAAIATSSAISVAPSSVPTTLSTMTRPKTSTAAATTTAAASAGCSNTSVEYNKCLDTVNVCVRNAHCAGAVDFSSCDALRSTCTMC